MCSTGFRGRLGVRDDVDEQEMLINGCWREE
jgi:hypothetical protein